MAPFSFVNVCRRRHMPMLLTRSIECTVHVSRIVSVGRIYFVRACILSRQAPMLTCTQLQRARTPHTLKAARVYDRIHIDGRSGRGSPARECSPAEIYLQPSAVLPVQRGCAVMAAERAYLLCLYVVCASVACARAYCCICAPCSFESTLMMSHVVR